MKQKWIIPATLMAVALASPAMAQLAQGDGPVNVSADNLEVMRDEHQAVYFGHVDVTQDKTRLQSDRIVIQYSKESLNDIQTITATGNVFYTTPEEVVRGDRAVYSLEKHTITMTGSVVLTQGENVITAQSLILDTKTGDAQFIAGEVGRQSKSRVRSVFFPKNDQTDTQTETKTDSPTPDNTTDTGTADDANAPQ